MSTATHTSSNTELDNRAKLTKAQPYAARVEEFIQKQVEACRPSAVKLAIAATIQEGFGLATSNPVDRATQIVDELENRMAKRLRRYYGLNGKYIGH